MSKLTTQVVALYGYWITGYGKAVCETLHNPSTRSTVVLLPLGCARTH